jgi:hypothetical protein
MMHRLGWNITNTANLGGAEIPGYIRNTGSRSRYAIQQSLLIQYRQYFKHNLGNLHYITTKTKDGKCPGYMSDYCD